MAKSQRKVKDRWKGKAWYSLHAPAMFNDAVMAWTPASSPEAVAGRVAEISLDQLSGDFSQKNYIVRFRVGEVRGPNAFTAFDGHRLTTDYKRALTRRRNTRVDCNFILTTADDVRLRLKPMLVVDNRIRGSQEKLLRARTTALVSETLSGLSLAEGLKRIYSGELARELAKELRIIYLTRRVEIAKIELLTPAVLMDVPPARAEGLKAQQPVTLLNRETGYCTPATLAYISPLVDPETRTVQARVELDNANGQWRPGQFLTVQLPTGAASIDTLAVPAEAVQIVDGQPTVYVPTKKDRTFKARPIAVGQPIDGWLPVHKGLAANEEVVVKGSFLLKAELGKAGAGHDHSH